MCMKSSVDLYIFVSRSFNFIVSRECELNLGRELKLAVLNM